MIKGAVRVIGAALFLLGSAGLVRADLAAYVKKPEPKFSWKLKSNHTTPLVGTVYDIELVSQEWHDITWKHQLQVYVAPGVKPTETMLLWNTGGSASLERTAFGIGMSSKVNAPVAFLYGIPNQPLFDGKKEDALIAETFVRTLETKDETWPLLLPMVKSVVKAMDALQEFGKEKWKQEVKSFIISGASKRGWTSWLTAAVDPRVKATAPLVIDTLNMVAQMKHQKESFGAHSEMISDYTARKLVPVPDTEEARRLWKMVDPYFYRDRLKMPKLLIMGNNDPYWTVDALNLYWDGLSGDKYVCYVPNAGHNLRQTTAPKGAEMARALNALSAFTRYQTTDKAMPKLQWKHDDLDGKARVSVTADQAPKAVVCGWRRLRHATSARRNGPSRSPRITKERSTLSVLTGLVDRPTEGFRAFYAELEYEIDKVSYTLSTQIRVLGGK